METKITFKFSEQQRVVTVLGDEGFISMLGVQNGTKTYAVNFKGGVSSWINEDQLKAV